MKVSRQHLLTTTMAAAFLSLGGVAHAQQNKNQPPQQQTLYKCTHNGQTSYQGTPCTTSGGPWVDDLTRQRQVLNEQRINEREQERIDRLQMQRHETERILNSVREANAVEGVDAAAATAAATPTVSDIPDISNLSAQSDIPDISASAQTAAANGAAAGAAGATEAAATGVATTTGAASPAAPASDIPDISKLSNDSDIPDISAKPAAPSTGDGEIPEKPQ